MGSKGSEKSIKPNSVHEGVRIGLTGLVSP